MFAMEDKGFRKCSVLILVLLREPKRCGNPEGSAYYVVFIFHTSIYIVDTALKNSHNTQCKTGPVILTAQPILCIRDRPRWIRVRPKHRLPHKYLVKWIRMHLLQQVSLRFIQIRNKSLERPTKTTIVLAPAMCSYEYKKRSRLVLSKMLKGNFLD